MSELIAAFIGNFFVFGVHLFFVWAAWVVVVKSMGWR